MATLTGVGPAGACMEDVTKHHRNLLPRIMITLRVSTKVEITGREERGPLVIGPVHPSSACDCVRESQRHAIRTHLRSVQEFASEKTTPTGTGPAGVT